MNLSLTKEQDFNASNLSNDNNAFRMDRTLLFWLFLVFDILAIIFNTFVLYQLLINKKSRQALHNHATILMLFFAFIYQSVDIPLHLDFFRTGTVRSTNHGLCLIWWYIDWCFFFFIVQLLMFISFERHILIFHAHLINSKRKRWILHYIPLITITVFIMLFYALAILSPICKSIFDYTMDLCGMHACFSSIPAFFLIEQIGFSAIPCILIIILNLALLIRVIHQKHHLHRSTQWKKQRKLAIQVLLMSSLYLIFAFPLSIIYIVRLWYRSDWANDLYSIYFYLSYFVILLLPLVCLAGLPKFSIRRVHRIHSNV